MKPIDKLIIAQKKREAEERRKHAEAERVNQSVRTGLGIFDKEGRSETPTEVRERLAREKAGKR